jgi:hypothetical protein
MTFRCAFSLGFALTVPVLIAGCGGDVALPQSLGELAGLCQDPSCGESPNDTPACELTPEGALTGPAWSASVWLPAAGGASSTWGMCSEPGALLTASADASLTFTLEERMAVELTAELNDGEAVELALASASACGDDGTPLACDVNRGEPLRLEGTYTAPSDHYLAPGDYVVFVRSYILDRPRTVTLRLRAVPEADNATCAQAEALELPATVEVDALGGGEAVFCAGIVNPETGFGSPASTIPTPRYFNAKVPPGHRLIVRAPQPVGVFVHDDRECFSEGDRCGAGGGAPDGRPSTIVTNPGDEVLSLNFGLSADALMDATIEAVPIVTNTTCLSATPLALEGGVASVSGEFWFNATTSSCPDVDRLDKAFFYSIELPPGSEAVAEGSEGTIVVAYEGSCQSNCSVQERPERATVSNPGPEPMTALFGVAKLSADAFDLSIVVDALAP